MLLELTDGNFGDVVEDVVKTGAIGGRLLGTGVCPIPNGSDHNRRTS